jgi:hypothetical protein
VPLVANAILDGHLPIIFGAILEPNFTPFLAFLRSWISQFYWVFCALEVVLGPFSDVVLDRTFLFIFGHFGITSRTVFERQIFVTIPSLRMDSPSLNRLLLAG